MTCLDCAKCVPAKKRPQIRDKVILGVVQLYVCKEKRRFISKKYFELFPKKYHCFVKKELNNEIPHFE